MVMVTNTFRNALTGKVTTTTYDTAERIGHADWVAKYFPEYVGLAVDNKVSSGGQTNSSGQTAPRITRTANTGAGAIMTPWASNEDQHARATANMSEGEKVAYWNKMNYFRNGGFDRNGNSTINPRDLDGMKPAGVSASGGVVGGWTTKDGGHYTPGQLPSRDNPNGINATYVNAQGIPQTESKYGFVHVKPDGTKYVPAWNMTARIIGHPSYKGWPGQPGPLGPYMDQNVGADINGLYNANSPSQAAPNVPYSPNTKYGITSPGTDRFQDVNPNHPPAHFGGDAPSDAPSSAQTQSTAAPDSGSSDYTPMFSRDQPTSQQQSTSGTSQQNARAAGAQPNQVPTPIFNGRSNYDYSPNSTIHSNDYVTHQERRAGGSPASNYQRPIFAGPSKTSTEWFEDLAARQRTSSTGGGMFRPGGSISIPAPDTSDGSNYAGRGVDQENTNGGATEDLNNPNGQGGRSDLGRWINNAGRNGVPIDDRRGGSYFQQPTTRDILNSQTPLDIDWGNLGSDIVGWLKEKAKNWDATDTVGFLAMIAAGLLVPGIGGIALAAAQAAYRKLKEAGLDINGDPLPVDENGDPISNSTGGGGGENLGGAGGFDGGGNDPRMQYGYDGYNTGNQNQGRVTLSEPGGSAGDSDYGFSGGGGGGGSYYSGPGGFMGGGWGKIHPNDRT
jgi:hypothetical protein